MLLLKISFPKEKIKVPFGFAVTAYAYNYFIKKNSLDQKIKDILDGLNTNNIRALEKAGLTVILVTHDQNVAKNARRIIVLRDGNVVQDTADIHQAIQALQAESSEEPSSETNPR